MDYEAFDREMSLYLVSCVDPHGTRFYIADNEYNGATDILSHARRFKTYVQAENAARNENDSDAWRDRWMNWAPISRAEV